MQEYGFAYPVANDEPANCSYVSNDTPWDREVTFSKLKWTRICWVIVAFLLVVAIGLQVLFYIRYSPAELLEDTVWQYEKLLNKEKHFARNMAPDQYWEHRSQLNDRSKAKEISEAVEKAKELHENHSWSYRKYKFELKILNQRDVYPGTQELLVEALVKRGIDPATVGTCKELSVHLTVVDYNDQSGTKELKLYAVEIGDYWYLMYENSKSREDYCFLVEDNFTYILDHLPRMF